MSGPGDIVKKYIQPGTRVGGRYNIEGYVGAGAYGVIFSAIDIETMERVAVKAIPPADDGVNRTAVGRFKREFKVISRLRHPNIITLYDFGETEHRIIYMVLEYIDGRTLYDVVTSEDLTDAAAISITRQIAAALAEAHGKGVIHRDLKPQNVMVSKDHAGGYKVKVLDFGMAKLLSGGADDSIVQLTREGVAVGTPRYIAPEQARGKEVGPYSDLYALGLLFYETFTGERAVKADTIESAIIAHVSPEPLELQEIERVPEYARPVLFRLIEKSVERRYQDARQVVHDLDQIDKMRHQAESAATVPLGSQQAPQIDTSVLEERRPKTSPAPRSIHSADNLELDYDRYEQYSQGESNAPMQKGRREIGQDFNFRTPHHIFEWAELAAAFFIAPFAFILFTAHFEGVDYFLRFFLGSLATFVPLGISLFMRSNDWSWSFFRLWVFGSVTAIILAHLMGIDDLAVGLLRNPGWFLSPVRDLPLFSTLFDIVASISRTYADLIADRSIKP